MRGMKKPIESDFFTESDDVTFIQELSVYHEALEDYIDYLEKRISDMSPPPEGLPLK